MAKCEGTGGGMTVSVFVPGSRFSRLLEIVHFEIITLYSAESHQIQFNYSKFSAQLCSSFLVCCLLSGHWGGGGVRRLTACYDLLHRRLIDTLYVCGD